LNEVAAMMKNPPHPGELLREDVLQPLGIEVTEAAQRLGSSSMGVPASVPILRSDWSVPVSAPPASG
jgi:hypothetical protein